MIGLNFFVGRQCQQECLNARRGILQHNKVIRVRIIKISLITEVLRLMLTSKFSHIGLCKCFNYDTSNRKNRIKQRKKKSKTKSRNNDAKYSLVSLVRNFEYNLSLAREREGCVLRLSRTLSNINHRSVLVNFFPLLCAPSSHRARVLVCENVNLSTSNFRLSSTQLNIVSPLPPLSLAGVLFALVVSLSPRKKKLSYFSLNSLNLMSSPFERVKKSFASLVVFHFGWIAMTTRSIFPIFFVFAKKRQRHCDTLRRARSNTIFIFILYDTHMRHVCDYDELRILPIRPPLIHRHEN